MRHGGERVHGPYQHRTRWRVILAGPKGKQDVYSFASESEARKFKAANVKEIAGRTVSEAVREHVASLHERGLRDSTIERAERHLHRFFQLDASDELVGGMLEDLRPRRCDELYKALRVDVKVDTHRNALSVAKAFGTWCVEQSWLRDNPVKDVKPIGERNRGKPQLRIDETRKLVKVCLELADDGHAGAVAVLTALLLGLRASEVTDRVVRDLDDDGRLLWVPFGKTRRSKRALEVPEMLRPYLLKLAEGRASDAQLVGTGNGFRRPTGQRRNRRWLLSQVQILCRKAEVPEVCAHSLRGLHATLATEAGATPQLVATALGHGSIQVAKMHYTDGATSKNAKARRLMGRLNGKRAGTSEPARQLPAGAGNG